MKMSNFTMAIHTDTLMLLNHMLHDKEQNLNYGSYANKDTSSEQRLGTPRSVSIFEEIILT